MYHGAVGTVLATTFSSRGQSPAGGLVLRALLHTGVLQLPPGQTSAPLMLKTSTDKARIKFLLLEGIHPSALEVLRAAGYSQIESLTGALEGQQLHAKIADAHFVGIRSRTQLTA